MIDFTNAKAEVLSSGLTAAVANQGTYRVEANRVFTSANVEGEWTFIVSPKEGVTDTGNAGDAIPSSVDFETGVTTPKLTLRPASGNRVYARTQLGEGTTAPAADKDVIVEPDGGREAFVTVRCVSSNLYVLYGQGKFSREA